MNGGMGPSGQWVRARTNRDAKRLLEEREFENSRIRPGRTRLSRRRATILWTVVVVVALVGLVLGVVID